MAVSSDDRLVWRAASDIAEIAADASSGAELGREVMTIVARLADCEVGSILSAAPGQDWVLQGQREDNEVLRRNHWRYATAMLPEELQRLTGSFCLDTELFARPRRERIGIYEDFMRPNHQAGFIARYWFMDGRLWGMGMSRSSVQFGELERERLDAIFPHLRAALRAGALLGGDRGSGDPWALTPAEEKVMSLVTRGLTNGEAARLLGISPNTLRNTLARVFAKVGVSRRSELAFIVGGGAAAGSWSRGRDPELYRRQVAAVEAIKRADPPFESPAAPR